MWPSILAIRPTSNVVLREYLLKQLSCYYCYWNEWESGESWLRHIANRLASSLIVSAEDGDNFPLVKPSKTLHVMV
jgi:hypothetical protein